MGAKLAGQYGHLVWGVDGISRPRRARAIARRLREIQGVIEAEASAAERIRIEYDHFVTGEEEIREVLLSMGVQPLGGVLDVRDLSREEAETPPVDRGPDEDKEQGHDHGGIFGEKTGLTFAILAGIYVAVGFGLSFVGGVSEWIPWGLYVGGYVSGGYNTVREAIGTLRAGGFEVDFLMLVAVGGGAGKVAGGGVSAVSLLAGPGREHYAMDRAPQTIESLAELAPDRALVRRNGKERDVSVEKLEVGDTVIVKPNERIPTDGFVVKGESAVNQAPVTAESVSVDKVPGGRPRGYRRPKQSEGFSSRLRRHDQWQRCAGDSRDKTCRRNHDLPSCPDGHEGGSGEIPDRTVYRPL